jgi:osmotically-inducible protein OsmY
MKPKIQSVVLTLCAALPLCLCVTGCQDKNATAAVDSPVSRAENDAAPRNADNTGINVRDRNSATLTPGDQGNSESDRTTTQKIRQLLVSGTNDYSVTAKNIKIITADGKVTLRGPVQTDAEKSGIVSIAKNIAGEGNVNDQLEVKTNPQP